MNVLLVLVLCVGILVAEIKCSSNVKVERVTPHHMLLGEGPHYSLEKNSVYFVDILDGTVNRYDLKENTIYSARIQNENTSVSFVIPVAGKEDEFIIGADRRILLIKWNGLSGEAIVLKNLGEVDKNSPDNRFNDAKADPQGRLFCGTMGSEEKFDLCKNKLGSLFRFEYSTGAKILKSDIGISNGLAWNERTNKFYYIDSLALDIKEYDFDPITGDISNEKVLINFNNSSCEKALYVPDGMTIDQEGNLYVATFGGSKVLKVNASTGYIEKEISIPTKQVTSVAFGGPNLDILYVTTAGKPSPQPSPAGALFKVTGLGVKGTKMHQFKM